ncbi:carboxylesterase family protein [Leucobacter sp. CSA1]|uniref:Carboxylic ester hydrolase n=1 Tax=Leucobacter chromiisoli TaxID=2796471 RepID=A0A934Q8N9_9MICO|nr:carboxylesterase family protein [Leucobacter chromiisoli]MBK0419768.1 carboxylesterase family protein [Leucobacter chromiisoli]
MHASDPAGSAPGPVVATPSGRVLGVWEVEARSSEAGPGTSSGAPSPARVAVFRGIPVAEPPVGPLRFGPPRPRAPWTQVRDATSFGATPQRGDVGITLIPEPSVPGDDTLSVNVWTPAPEPGAALPVVVWIHGGGYVSGAPTSPWYDGRSFARDGVVLVSLSYRLGFEGFGWVEGAVQNRGALDWIRALEWVRDHIAAFGGDPGRVVVAGQSAGGGAALALLGAPGARGLFHGAYAMSPAVPNPSPEAARRHARRLARLAGVEPDLAGFSSVPAERLHALQQRVASPRAPHVLGDVRGLLREGLMLGPVADGEVLETGISEAVVRGTNASVPIVLGTVDDEICGLFPPGGFLDRAPKHALLRTLGAPADAAARWLAANPEAAAGGTAAMLGRYATDAVFRSWIPFIAASRGAAARGGAAADVAARDAVAAPAEGPDPGPTWTYRFAWHGEDPPRAGHCIDVPFAFDRLDGPGVDRVAGAAPPQSLADAVHGALVAFARDGDPGWAPNQDGAGPSRIFDEPVGDRDDAYAAARALRPEG